VAAHRRVHPARTGPGAVPGGPAAWTDDGDDPRYARLAGWAYSWFLGRNRVGARLYAEWSGGCNDGLSATAANPNQGAESTLAYYQALFSLVGSGLAKLPARTANGPERTVVTKRAMTRSTRPATATHSTIAPAGTTHPRLGNHLRSTEGPTDAR
jgi:hypothetical protein